MIRFRFRDDERRFVKLHAELYERLARAGLPAETGSEAVRNVGKIEQLAFLEGLRQGLAMAAIAQQMIEHGADAIPPPYSFKAFQLHALLYGSADTPLRDVEKEWMEKLGLDPEHLSTSWMDDKPMRYAPATTREISGEEPPIAPMISVQSATKPMPVLDKPSMKDLTAALDTALAEMPAPTSMHGAEVMPPEPHYKGEYEPDDDEESDEDIEAIIRRAGERTAASVNEPATVESPDLLDEVRSQMQQMRSSGWEPKSWTDLILDLSRSMKRDAGYLDLQLTTDVGRAVLAQCGLTAITPPSSIDIITLKDMLDRSTLDESSDRG